MSVFTLSHRLLGVRAGYSAAGRCVARRVGRPLSTHTPERPELSEPQSEPQSKPQGEASESERPTSQPAAKAAEDADASLRERLLEAALKEVPKHGWNVSAISAGAVACGLAPTAHGILPRGPIELVRYFNTQCDETLRAELEARQEELEQLEVQNRLIIAIETRLNMLHPYVETWPQALALRALPANLRESAADAHELSNLLLLACGSEAEARVAPTLLDPHVKRAALAALYGAAELYLLTDRSPGFSDTSCFLEREVSALQHAASATAALHAFNPAALLSMLAPRK